MTENVFLYCERGTDPDLFAEPLNAVTNAAFLIAALAALWLLMRRPRDERSADHYLLIALAFTIGLGSLAFHLFANRLTALADVIPIGLFMLVYVGFALNRFLRVPPGWTVLLVIGFAATIALTMQLRCLAGAVGFGGEEGGPCLNGSVAYLPALLALFILSGLLYERGHRAAGYLLAAGLVFALSITFRSIDMAVCDTAAIGDHAVGTHFLWHLLNAVTIFLLLRASLEAGPRAGGGFHLHRPTEREIQEPEAHPS
jgi:hypothetical protein